MEHFQKLNLGFSFVYGLDSESFSDGPVHKTMKSLISGHMNCILDAKENRYEKILVCEDDVSFVNNVNEKFNQFISNLNNGWDFLQLGNQFWANEYLNRKKIRNNLYEFIWGTGSHCVGINEHMYDDCLKFMSNYDDSIDFIYYKLFKNHVVYCPENFLADALSKTNSKKYVGDKYIFNSEVRHNNELE